MAELIPILVATEEELALAIKLKRSAIFVTNKEMHQKLAAKELTRRFSKFGKTAGPAVGIVSLLAAALGPIGIFTAAITTTCASALTFGASTFLGISLGKMKHYKIIILDSDNPDGEDFLLVKIKGTNAVNKKDTVKLPDGTIERITKRKEG